ncbi:MAG: GNAT family N-acetyltransferase [candidate division WOR-3 bacterium]|nr:MAG: GNAT family N-acetyltransferase [candidate division WOR-3 bacterium]
MKRTDRLDNIVIRRARIGDDAALVRLLSELGYRCSQGFARSKIRQLSGKASDRIFVAVEKQVVTAFISCHILPMVHQRGFLCRVTAICVLPEWRARGIGKLLMETVEDFARSRDCAKIEITSGKHRKIAHEFYRRAGYHTASARFVKEL